MAPLSMQSPPQVASPAPVKDDADIADEARVACLSEEEALQLEAECLHLIHEFLLSYELRQSASALVRECPARGLPPPSPPRCPLPQRLRRDALRALLRLFDAGDPTRFFNAWESLVPVAARRSAGGSRLTFYLHVHFAVLPLRSADASSASAASPIASEANIAISAPNTAPSDKEEADCTADTSKGFQKEAPQEERGENEDNSASTPEPVVDAAADNVRGGETKDADSGVGKDSPRSEGGGGGGSDGGGDAGRERTRDAATSTPPSVAASAPASRRGSIATRPADEGSGGAAHITNDDAAGDGEGRSLKGEEGAGGSMALLRRFLETKGPEFSHEAELLPFYALPFVSRPQAHPSFMELFQARWAERLRMRLRAFLHECCWGPSVAPTLLRLLAEGAAQGRAGAQRADRGEGHGASSPRGAALAELNILRRRTHRLERDHHCLLGVAAQLAGALENHLRGEPVDLSELLRRCGSLCPELFAVSAAPSTPTPGDLPAAPTAAWPPGLEAHPAACELDFRKIRQHLATGSVKTRLLLLQALRWRLTRSAPDERDAAAAAFLRHDVLQLRGGGGSGGGGDAGALLSGLVRPPGAATPHPLQQAATRLVNALASLRAGRDYLATAGGAPLLQALIPCLADSLPGGGPARTDALTADMALAALQKLSLRRSPRLHMLRLGLLEWLVRRLRAPGPRLRPYALEYAAALLMNLCLHRRARERLAPMAGSALRLLADLLAADAGAAPVRPYVNGALYSLLAHPAINQEARRMGLANTLEHQRKRAEGEARRQLEHILRLLHGDAASDALGGAASDEDADDDDAEEADVLEEELEAEDPVRAPPGDLCGEELLRQRYKLIFPSAGVVHPGGGAGAATGSGEAPLDRPTTARRSRPPSAASASSAAYPPPHPPARSHDPSPQAPSSMRSPALGDASPQGSNDSGAADEDSGSGDSGGSPDAARAAARDDGSGSVVLESVDSDGDSERPPPPPPPIPPPVLSEGPAPTALTTAAAEPVSPTVPPPPPPPLTSPPPPPVPSPVPPPKPPTAHTDDEATDEFLTAFTSRPRIPRTPTPVPASPSSPASPASPPSSPLVSPSASSRPVTPPPPRPKQRPVTRKTRS